MPSTRRSSKQAAKDRAALKRLRNSGKYAGKIDLRKPPTRYQLKKLAELRAARKPKTKTAAKTKSGKARKPRPPRHKVPGAKISTREISGKAVRNLKEPKHKLTTYALPFLRKGQDEPEWRRFTYKQLRAFIAEYKADDPEGGAEWMSYAVQEKWTFDTVRQVADMRRETNVYFSGVRIAHPEGKIRKHVQSQSAAAKRKRKQRARK